MKSFGGHLLIASPYLSDRNFFRSVVLIVSHDEKHAFGLLLNRPGHDRLGTVWEKLTGEPCEQIEPIRSGGPLEGPLMMIHQRIEFSDKQVIPGVYLSTAGESVASLVATNCRSLIAVTGYSGWVAGQLETELKIGGWMSMMATEELIFADPNEQWKIAARQISDGILGPVHMQHAPKDPSWN